MAGKFLNFYTVLLHRALTHNLSLISWAHCYFLIRFFFREVTNSRSFYVFSAGGRRKTDDSFGEACVEEGGANASGSAASATTAARAVATTAASVASNAASAASSGIRAAVQPRQAKVTNNEKTLLLSSDDEFQ